MDLMVPGWTSCALGLKLAQTFRAARQDSKTAESVCGQIKAINVNLTLLLQLSVIECVLATLKWVDNFGKFPHLSLQM